MSCITSKPKCLINMPGQCVFYNGSYLSTLNVSLGERYDDILVKINALIGTGGGGGGGTADGNNFPSALSFVGGTLTIERTGLTPLTQSLDGRYALIGNTEAPISFTAPLSRSTNTVSISQATATSNGYLSQTDWNTFNNKVSTSRTIIPTAPLTGGGDLSTNRTIGITQATTTTNGYLSSTDWNTFNNKIDPAGAYANPTWITSLAWSKITGTPNTVVGYGITDAVTPTGTSTLTNKTLGTGTKINLGTVAAGDMYYGNASGTLVRLPKGSDTHVLTLVAGLPTWAAPPSGGGGGGWTPALRVVTTSTNFLTTDQTLLVDTSAGNITITVNALGVGALCNIKKITSDINTVTVVQTGGLIEGAASYLLDGFNEVVNMQSDGTNLYILSKL